MRRFKNKEFDYQPRFYKPEEDEEEKRKRKLGFRSGRKHKRKVKTPLYWLILIALVLYAYMKLNGLI